MGVVGEPTLPATSTSLARASAKSSSIVPSDIGDSRKSRPLVVVTASTSSKSEIEIKYERFSRPLSSPHHPLRQARVFSPEVLHRQTPAGARSRDSQRGKGRGPRHRIPRLQVEYYNYNELL